MKTSWYLIPRQLLVLLLLGLPGVAWAQFSWANSNGAITITGYAGPGGAVAIPATISNLPVVTVRLDGVQISTAGAGNPTNGAPGIASLLGSVVVSNSVAGQADIRINGPYAATGSVLTLHASGNLVFGGSGTVNLAGDSVISAGGDVIIATGVTINASGSLSINAGGKVVTGSAGAINGSGGGSVSVTSSGSPVQIIGSTNVLINAVAMLPVQVVGQGTISPNYSNAVLKVGGHYHMTATAKPGSGFAFTNWTGFNTYTLASQIIFNLGTITETNVTVSTDIVPEGVLTNGPTLAFTMTGPQNIYTTSGTNADGSVITNTILTLIQGYQANFVDVTKPVLHITSPTAGAFVTNYNFLVQGTAVDNAGVSNVWYQFNGGGWQNPNSLNQWSVPVTLNPGTNTIQAYAVDTSGNVSATNTVNFVYVFKVPFFLTINGQGTVTPNYRGQQLQVGQNYAMTAIPAKGFAFTNWHAVSLIQPLQEGNTNTVTPQFTGIIPSDPPFYLTNSPTLQFTMGGFLAYIANFVDIAPPVVTITAPTPSDRVSNSVFTVTGTARDNAGVAGVYYQLNGADWQSVSTGNGYTNWFIPNLPLVSEATNILQVYAMDTSSNVSPTTTIAFKNLQQDPAPASLANTLANGRSFAGTGFTFDFGTNTFSLAPYVTGQTPSVGQYSYEKLSPTNGELSFASTAPPSAAGGLVTLDLTFTARDYGTYSNEISGDTGTITFGPTYPLIPGTLAGKTMQLFCSNGVAATLNFAGATVSFTNTSGDGGAAHYAYEPASQISGLLAWGDAEQGTNYLVLINDYTNVGAYYASAYDAAGKATGSDSGIYALPASAPSAPASLNGTEAQIHGSDGSQSVIAFGAGTYSVFSYDSPPTAGAGTYGYAQNHTRSARLSLAATWPPGTTNGGQSFALNFVTPRCAWYTNPAAATSNIECLVLFPAITEAPASVTGLTLHATNYTERFINNQFVPTVEAIELQARGFFTQVETAGSQQTTNAGTWKYQVYSPVVAVFQLNYRGSGSLAGATNYLQATFYQAGSGLLNETFFDHAGDPAVTSLAGFSIY